MTPRGKRQQPSSSPAAPSTAKKPRRSQRLQDQPGNGASDRTASPDSRHVQVENTPASSPIPQDTQIASQFYAPPQEQDYEDVNDDSIWGYLLALSESDPEKKVIKLNKSSKCASEGRRSKNKASAGGFLIGRHAECDLRIDSPVISNRHCVIYKEISGASPRAVLEDLSQNGTWVNRIVVGRNNRRDLETGDEIEFAGGLQYVFRYPRKMHASGFRESYTLGRTLGSGHFATVHIAVDNETGAEFAVKIFKNRRTEDKARTSGLQQEIAVLMSVSHPNVLCLRATYEEPDGVYLVLELAKEGELFNYIIQNTKLSESETRTIYKQLLQGLKYLHDRNIVHRDIKPENILLCDKQLTIKLADFGLAKIIGEDSFTNSLCGTPSYVAPEILENSRTRKYSRAVDMWSLGVVLYICLCGFPPFSDELNTPENPYNLSQQIKMGRFDFPSPYWDSVGDPALDLIEKMLDVNPDSRITVDEALKHPWITGQVFGVAGSCDSLTAGMESIGFARRRVTHERTLLAEAPDLVGELKSSPVERNKVNPKDKTPEEAEEQNGTKNKVENKVEDEVKDEGENEGKNETENEVENETKNEVRDGSRPENLEAGTKAFMEIGGRGGDGTLYGGDDSYYQVSQVDLESSSS